MATKRIVKATRASVPAVRPEQMHLRVSADVKELLKQAAAMSTGGNVTAFVVGAATERAHSVVSGFEFDDQSRRRFYDLVMNPPEPSEALKRLIASDQFRIVS